jgi:asparaginyl-tRNA synthetase
MEAEAPWINLDELMDIQEKLIFNIIDNIKKNNYLELDFLNKNSIIKLKEISLPFERITYNKAIDILRSKDFKIKEDESNRFIQWGDDLNIESERELTKDKKNPMFVYHYPLKIKPFYVKQNQDNPLTGLAVDLLAPQGYGEISGGSIREENLEKIRNRITESELNPKDYQWYLDLRRYGSIPHGGFGLGIERILRWILGFDDIKDVVLFPRTMSRITP